MASFRQSALAFARSVLAIVRTERLPLMAGGIAYFTALAVVPLLIAFASVAGLFVSEQDLDQVIASVGKLIPNLDEATLSSLVTLVNQTSRTAFTASSIAAILVGVYGASRVVIGLRMSLDAIFNVPVIRGGVVARIIAALFTLLLLIGAVLITVGLTVVPTVTDVIGVNGTAAQALLWIIATALIALVLWLIYRFGPHARVALPWWSPGVWFATAWIVVVTGFLGYYVSFSTTFSAAVIALGAPIVLLLWVYLVAFGALLGASVVAASRAPTGTSEEGQSPER